MKAKQKTFAIRRIIVRLWQSRKMICWCWGLTTLFGLIVAIGTPRRYTVTSVLAPEATATSGLSSLASMVGVNLNGIEANDAIDPSLFPEIASSLQFLRKIGDTTVRTENDSTTMTYQTYLKTRPILWIDYILHMPSIIAFKLHSVKPLPSVGGAAESDSSSYMMIGEMEKMRLEAIGKKIIVSQNAKNGLITASVSETDPMVATMVNVAVLKVLQQSIVDYKTNKAQADLQGYQRLSDQLYAEYDVRQKAFADFVGRHRNSANEYINAERDRLQAAMELTLNSLHQVNQQRYLAEATLVEKKPAFAIIEPPIYPIEPSNSRKLLLLGWSFIGLLLSSLWAIYGKVYWQRLLLLFKHLRRTRR